MYTHYAAGVLGLPTVLCWRRSSGSLNVASTRLILLHGTRHGTREGDQASAVRRRGNYVGIVVFAILSVNFVVITKARDGRRVAARFTLDAMPGKQMAIDADLNAGLVDEAEARRRRSVISREADFYGAMDGASKFVRGDAVAGIIIALVNIFGGLFVGVIQQGLDVRTAAQTYTILTIGDGLVAQIPAHRLHGGRHDRHWAASEVTWARNGRPVPGSIPKR
jgi:flagellar biosynthesis protein FlhA